jgi:hypothetical protein
MRYVIAVHPIALLAIACGVDGLLERVEAASPFSPRWTQRMVSGAVAGGLAALVWLGPLPDTYSGRNDFTNHKDFQRSYTALARIPWFRVGGASGDDPLRPAFYDRLAADDTCEAVIEYPFLIGDASSPYFFHQRRHRKRVLGGYFHTPDAAPRGEQPGIVGANWIVDHVLLEVKDPEKLRFRNLVDLGDPVALRASGACHLIVHSHPELEIRGKHPHGGLAPAQAAAYASRFGQPAYADGSTTVFDLRRLPK